MSHNHCDSSDSVEFSRRQAESGSEASRSNEPRLYCWPESEYYISEKHRLVYCPIQKVACSSLKLWFAALVDGPQTHARFTSATSHGLAVDHGALNEEYKLHGKPLLERRPLDDGEWMRFVFVRNPWSRLVSTFVNKFVPVHDLTMPVFQAAQRRWGGPLAQLRAMTDRRRASNNATRTQPLTIPLWQMFRGVTAWQDEFTFRHFVEYLNEVDLGEGEVDLHWRPQYRFMGNTRFDFVGRFEQLHEDLATLARLRNLSIELPSVNRTEYRRNRNSFADAPLKVLRRLRTSPSYQQFYTSQLRELVEKLYHRDIEQFGYSYE
jgi:hypothetical protein